MIHRPTKFEPTGKLTANSGQAILRCPLCGKPSLDPEATCTGRAEVTIVSTGKNLDCVHRLEKVGTVPCGTCPTNRNTRAVVYSCRANGGQCCVLYSIGDGPDQRFNDAKPVVCSTCPLRQPPTNNEG